MAQNKTENTQEVVNVEKKENFIKRGWKWTKSHVRDIGLGAALGLSIFNTAVLVMANIGGIEAEIDSDTIDSLGESVDMGIE
jgi:hypothetical protein